ncbi:arsenate reductase ArsC [Pelagicoccus enzymogenes]|uniref:arsenate reductase ArsC n=1 Tax=Pelagicoccus enzymogenes TaxID=2773457 RepID=UPI00280FA291|nr:arsenate reductase ArsC [Pelagicoccus enzymogenes]MDQ8197890.1 arsenate reductase ArsC [Pelagicoccus enzymogenes]
MDKLRILFLCTGNSARSILAEHILRKRDPARFESFSAGASPKDEPHPMALKVLQNQFRVDTSKARSKSWDEFEGVRFDIVITVCDNARESCPVWPGQPIVAHWGSPDPAAFEGTEEDTYRFFKDVGIQISRRIDLLTALPFEKLWANYRLKLEEDVKRIGERESFSSVS